MTAPVRLQLSRRKGFDLQAISHATNGLPVVNVARPTRWGNPHRVWRVWGHAGMPELGLPAFDAKTARDADDEGARIAVALFRKEAVETTGRFEELRGKNLACWCRPGAPCHADVLLELANTPSTPI